MLIQQLVDLNVKIGNCDNIYCLVQFFAVKFMAIQQVCYFQNYIFFAVYTQNFVAVFKIEIPFFIWKHFVNIRLELPGLVFCFDRSFENVNHFLDKVVNRFSRFFIDAVNPSLKPISIIFSMRVSDSL